MELPNWLITLIVIGAIVYYGGYISDLPYMLNPNYVSVKDLIMETGHTGHVVSLGYHDFMNVLERPPIYLVSKDGRYKVLMTGNVPPLTSNSCGLFNYPYYEVDGIIYATVNSPNNGISIDVKNYTLISCKNLDDLAQHK